MSFAVAKRRYQKFLGNPPLRPEVVQPPLKPIRRQLTPPAPPVVSPPRPLTPPAVVLPRSLTPPVMPPPVRRLVSTEPTTFDQDLSYIREVCTVEGQGYPDDVVDALRRDVFWVRSYSSSTGRLESIGRLQMQLGEIAEKGRVTRVTTIESVRVLASSQA